MTMRVLYILDCYPQLSQTYIKTEIEDDRHTAASASNLVELEK